MNKLFLKKTNISILVIWIVIVSILSCIIIAICFLPNSKSTDIDNLDDQLQIFLDTQVAEHNRSEESNDNFISISYDFMEVDKTSSKISIYAWILYMEYSCENGALQEEAGSHIPTIISAKRNGNSYELIEYWTPRDGSYYVNDIKTKFPSHLWTRAIDSQQSVKQQKEECEQRAMEHFNISASTNISKLEQYKTEYIKNVSNVSHIALLLICSSKKNDIVLSSQELWDKTSQKIS